MALQLLAEAWYEAASSTVQLQGEAELKSPSSADVSAPNIPTCKCAENEFVRYEIFHIWANRSICPAAGRPYTTEPGGRGVLRTRDQRAASLHADRVTANTFKLLPRTTQQNFTLLFSDTAFGFRVVWKEGGVS